MSKDDICSNDIHQRENPSIQHHIKMSFSIKEPLTIPMHRKRTISERVTNNGDPLIAKKKAREVVKLASALSAEVPSKNISKACIL